MASQGSQLSALDSALRATFGACSNRSWALSAPAKVNLRLKVTGRRDDGYHYLSMLTASCSLQDELRVAWRETSGISVAVDLPSLSTLPEADNLVAKAYRAFWGIFGCSENLPGFDVSITKRIPVGGGLGGGSSDAGAVLRFLVALFGPVIKDTLQLSDEAFEARVMAAALACGADVPYAYHGGVAWVSGVGDVVTQLPLVQVWSGLALISVPSRPVPTAEFYRAYRESHPHITPYRDVILEQYCQQPEPLDAQRLLDNDFEDVACQLVPEVGRALALARGVFPHTVMTGSGSAIVSLVADGGDPGVVAEYERAAMSQGVVVHHVSL